MTATADKTTQEDIQAKLAELEKMKAAVAELEASLKKRAEEALVAEKALAAEQAKVEPKPADPTVMGVQAVLASCHRALEGAGATQTGPAIVIINNGGAGGPAAGPITYREGCHVRAKGKAVTDPDADPAALLKEFVAAYSKEDNDMSVALRKWSPSKSMSYSTGIVCPAGALYALALLIHEQYKTNTYVMDSRARTLLAAINTLNSIDFGQHGL